MKILTIVVMFIVISLIIPNISAQSFDESMEKIAKSTEMARENQKILLGITGFVNKCTSYLETFQISKMDRCFEFMTDFNTKLNEIKESYPEIGSSYGSGFDVEMLQKLLRLG